MNIPDELLAAYLDGQLDAAERARIEQAILGDARLAKRVARYRASHSRLRGALNGVLHQSIPQRRLQSARSAAPRMSAQIIDLARVRAERKRRSERHPAPSSHRMAIAASLLGGLLMGLLVERLAGSGALTEYRGGALLASGALAAALNTQLANSPAPGSKVRVGLSFRAKGGDYCRTFAVTDTHSLAGLACHERNQWQVVTLVGAPPEADNVSNLRVAASTPPPMLLQAVRERIAGSPLDAQAEARARGGNWR